MKPGVWHWQAPHPEWTAPEDWTQTDVSSYAIDDGQRLLLFDPLEVPADIESLASNREPLIVLTCPWHRRDAQALAEKHGWPIHVPPPDPPDPDPVEGKVFEAGQRLSVGIEAILGMEPNDLLLWVGGHRALVAGDTLVDRGRGSSSRSTGRTEGLESRREDPRAAARPARAADRARPADARRSRDRAALEHALASD